MKILFRPTECGLVECERCGTICKPRFRDIYIAHQNKLFDFYIICPTCKNKIGMKLHDTRMTWEQINFSKKGDINGNN